MKKYIVLIIMILFFAIPHIARAQFEFSSSTWSDASPWFGENAIYISVWVGDGERVGINRENPRYEFDLSGDMAWSGDATCDGNFYVNGAIDISGDIALDSVTISEDITFDASAFITVDLDVSEDLTTNTIQVSSDATFDGTVSLSENVTFSMAADEYLLLDAATAVHTQTAGALDINVVNGANSVAGIYMDLEAENGWTPLYGLYINIDDDGAGGDETVHGIYMANSEGTASLTQGITFANTLDDNIVSTMGAAGQFAVIDAATTQNTTTDGIIDIEFDSTADGAEVINIDVDVETSSDSSTVSAIYIDLDDDTDQTADIIGLKVYSGDVTGASGTTVYGVYTEGVDCAIQADNGYVRIGTGSTADVTPGDDDIFVEGTSEVDGAARFDGAVTCNSTVGLSENVTFTMAADEYLLLDAATTPMTQTAGALDINVINGATAVSAINIDLEAENTFAALYGVYINIDDDATNDEEHIHAIYVDNDGGTASNTYGMTVTNKVDIGLGCTVGAAMQAVVIDAAATDHTGTSGIIDIAFDSTADGASVINIDMDVDTSSDSATVSAILIDLDDDTDQTADIIGVQVSSSDLTGASGTTVTGFYSSGLDCAIQADNGYVRIGTGSTPDVTPGDDDIFGEGTIEIDGAARFDGAVDCNGGVDVTGGLTTNTIIVSGDTTCDGGLYVVTGMDVSDDTTLDALTVSGDVSCDSTVSINSLLIYEPSTAQVIDATSDAILANATMVILNPDADYTTDVTPTIADGTIGQIVYITCTNGEANRVRLQDQDHLAGTNLQLEDTSVDVSGRDVLTLLFDGTDWIQQNYQDN